MAYTAADERDGIQHELGYIVAVAAGENHCEWDATTVSDQLTLGAGPAFCPGCLIMPTSRPGLRGDVDALGMPGPRRGAMSALGERITSCPCLVPMI